MNWSNNYNNNYNNSGNNKMVREGPSAEVLLAELWTRWCEVGLNISFGACAAATAEWDTAHPSKRC